MLRVSILCIHSANRSSNVNRWKIIVIVVVVVEKRLQYFVVFFIVLCCVVLRSHVCYFSLFSAAVHILPFKLRVPQRAGDMLFFRRARIHISTLTMVLNGKLNRTEQKTASHKLFKTFERLVFFSAFVVEKMQLQIMLQWLRATATYKTRTPYTYKCAVA